MKELWLIKKNKEKKNKIINKGCPLKTKQQSIENNYENNCRKRKQLRKNYLLNQHGPLYLT